jgi:predicted Zn-dependent protease
MTAPPFGIVPRSGLAALLGTTVALSACAVNPATGERQFSLISEGQEIQMGREADADVTASLGLVQDEALQRYVDGIGQRLAANSERPDLPWSFKVVDDPVVNAFALPGGFIYVTRGILANFESEAELAGVLGHEIGHVTARHSVSQMSRQQLQQVGLGVGMILSEDVRRFGDVLAAGLGLLNLRYSRGDETQSDELGVRYMTRAGYDAGELVGVFQMLASVSGGEGGRVPEWQLTHPYPENREAHIREVIAATGVPAGGRVDRDALLDRLVGLTYGPNPRDGYFRGARFYHPEMAFELTFPEGWKTVNQRSAVGAISPSEDAIVVLELVPEATEPLAALQAFLAQDGVEGGAIRQDDAYGIPSARAPFSLTSGETRLRGVATFLRHRDRLFRILGYSTAQKWSGYERVVVSAHGTFRPVTDQAVLGVQPWRVEIVTIPSAMTMAAFHERYPSIVPLEEVARLNRVAPDESLRAGSRVKRIVGAPLP